MLGEQNNKTIGRRFLQSFKKGILGLLPHGMCPMDDVDLNLPLMGANGDILNKTSDLMDPNTGTLRSYLLKIRVIPLSDPMQYRMGIPDSLGQQCLSKGDGRLPLLGPPGTGKNIAVGYLIPFYGFGQSLNNPMLADNPLE